jgi:8-oxo-dGTP diphosphatase
VLVTKRGVEPHRGKFDIPGGFLRAGEDVIEGLRRELREELQVEVDVSMDDVVQMVPHEYGPEGDFVLAIGFAARLVSGEVTPGSDVEEAHWITREQIDDVGFAWEHDRELVRRVFEHEAQEAADTH